jgi:lipopolysaccharide export system permease protein
MNSTELKQHINRLKMFGLSDKAKYTAIDLNMRYASVFAHIIVMMIGIPFALGFGNKFNKIISFTLALFAAFTYWGAQTVTRSLGESSVLSPFMAGWLSNFVFAFIGICLICKVRK